LALIGLPSLAFYFKTTNDDEKRLCQENLQIFYQAVKLAEERPNGIPTGVGRQFLIAIAQNERVNHALVCPAVSRSATLRAVDFRGPARPWSELKPEDPLMAD